MNRRGFFGRLATLGTTVAALPPWTPQHKAVDGDSWVWRQDCWMFYNGEPVKVMGGWFKPVDVYTADGRVIKTLRAMD